MNIKRISIFFVFILVSTVTLTVCLQNGVAQNYTQWNLPEGAKARLGKGSISEIAYSPDGTLLAAGSSIGVWIYNAQSGEELALFTEHPRGVSSVSFSPDGKTLASGSASGDAIVRLWDISTGTLKDAFAGHTFVVTSVSFSPDGKTLASGSHDGTIHLWDIDTSTLKNILVDHPLGVNSVSFSPDGKTLASAGVSTSSRSTLSFRV